MKTPATKASARHRTSTATSSPTASARSRVTASLEIDPATGAFTYVPAHDYHGSDGFTFEVSDGKLKSEAVVRLAGSGRERCAGVCADELERK